MKCISLYAVRDADHESAFQICGTILWTEIWTFFTTPLSHKVIGGAVKTVNAIRFATIYLVDIQVFTCLTHHREELWANIQEPQCWSCRWRTNALLTVAHCTPTSLLGAADSDAAYESGSRRFGSAHAALFCKFLNMRVMCSVRLSNIIFSKFDKNKVMPDYLAI